MITPSTQAKFTEIIDQYGDIYVIVSPPRCSSTAFARVFWEQPSVRYYSHEPFEGMYFTGQDLNYVINNLRNPLDLQDIKNNSRNYPGNNLVIKEMPYQVGQNFTRLISLTRKPVVFLTRDPRQNIASSGLSSLKVMFVTLSVSEESHLLTGDSSPRCAQFRMTS